MLRSLTIAAIAATAAAPALAGTVFTATLETPVAERERLVASKALWTCEGETCTAELKRKTVTVRACKRLAKEIGTLADFSNGEESLDETDLASCNTVAKS